MARLRRCRRRLSPTAARSRRGLPGAARHQGAAALSNVEQELTSRYQKAWTTDLAAAYLAATYRLLQRRDDAERIIGGVPWSTAGTGNADDIYYNRAVHDAQLLYVLAKHFPARLGSSPPAALEAVSAAASGSQASRSARSHPPR
jgi:uncharacterized protein YfaS (alpha-2-macroglobulin family)